MAKRKKRFQCSNTTETSVASGSKSALVYAMWSKCWAFNHRGNLVPWGTGTSIAFTFNLGGGGTFPNSPSLHSGIGPGSFHQWVESQVGPMNVGDSFVFDMLNSGFCTSPWGSSVNKICLRYDGLGSGNPGMQWWGTNATAHSKDCCDRDPILPGPCDEFLNLSPQLQNGCCEKCKASGGFIGNPLDPCNDYCKCCPDPEPETSWDCEEITPVIIDDTNPNNPTHQCVQRSHTNGQFATVQDCISSGCGSNLPAPSLKIASPLTCTLNDIKNAAGQYLYPIYSSHPSQPMSVWYTNFLDFQSNMWSHYQSGGCGWWANRISWWQGFLTSGVNAQGNPINPYQASLLNAKIDFAQAMHVLCNCPGPAPTAIQPMSSKMINSFNIDYTDIPTNGGTKSFSIKGDQGASFYLEVKNEDGYYYNFTTKTFGSRYAKLDVSILGNEYNGEIVFPTVTDDDQYDLFLYAKQGTSHPERNTVLFRDGSVDLNASNGSNDILLQKVLHQVLDVTLTLSMYSGTGAIAGLTIVNDTVAVGRYGSNQLRDFITTATRSSNALTIDRQPLGKDILTFHEPVVGSAPIQIPGENIYPAVSGTNTVNGAVTSGTTVTMDVAVASRMKVGDRVTGNAALNATTATVVSLDSTYDFTLSEAIAIADGIELSFSNQVNYRWPVDNAKMLKEGMVVVASTNVAAGTKIAKYEEKTVVFQDTEKEEEIIIKEVNAVDTSKSIPTVSQGIETVAPGEIVFNNQMPLALAGDTLKVGGYGIDEIKRVSGWDLSFSDLKVELNEITTTTTSGVSSSATMPVASVVGIADETTQTLNDGITSSKKMVLNSVDGLFVGQTIYAVSAGSLSGNPTVTSINEVTKEITLSSKQTFAKDITLTFANSIVSGPGIAAGVVRPYVTNISGSNLTLSAAQTLENGQTFKFTNAGNVATLTGNVIINKAGSENLTIRFDVEKFLTYHS